MKRLREAIVESIEKTLPLLFYFFFIFIFAEPSTFLVL
jgi:hypothetical protein